MKNLRVCLVTEGTYPYVVGGVSSWVHRLITQLKDVTFEVLAIVPAGELKEKYSIPPNLKNIYRIPIIDEEKFTQPKIKTGEYYEKYIRTVKWLHQYLGEDDFNNASEYLVKLHSQLENERPRFWASKPGWEYLKKQYSNLKEAPSMIEWILAWKDTHIPLLNLTASLIPEADIYHATNSGFAGFLAIIGAMKHNKPSIITDHGIFLRERLMELSKAKIKGLAEEMWLDVLTGLSRLIYTNATLVTSVCNYNVNWVTEKLRIPRDKFKVIYNGVDPERLKPVETPKPPYRVVGSISRVHPIKDIKTFIKAADIVLKKEGNVKFFVVGPVDDQKYYKECLNLIKKLGISENFIFTGSRGEDILYWYNLFDIFVLSSISEGFPMSTIEAMACGTPVIVTDVGGAAEPVEDCGYVIPSGDAEQLAQRILEILQSKEVAEKFSENARRKVVEKFSLSKIMSEYEKVYQELAVKK
ncbi:MAG: GT4 family glycosyltransferase PelF [Candidatus Odinarchaeota archaeon]